MKLKKIIIGIGVFVVTLPVRICRALDWNDVNMGNETVYGVPREEPSLILGVLRMLIIPILLIIGLITIIKNKKMSKTSKIIISIIAILIAIILFFII